MNQRLHLFSKRGSEVDQLPYKEITSTRNPVAMLVRKTKQAKSGRELGLFLMEGRHLLREALHVNWPMECVLLAPDAVKEWGAALNAAGLQDRTYLISAGLLDNLSSLRSTQGVLALGKRPENLLPRCLPGRFYLFLDEVQDPVNVGILVRSAYAFGFTAVMLGEGTADAYGSTAMSRSAGASLYLSPARCPIQSLLAWVSEGSASLVAADAQGEPAAFRTDLQTPVVLALGNEGRGLNPAVLAAASARISIPMQSGWDSLNVASAGSILMHILTTPSCP